MRLSDNAIGLIILVAIVWWIVAANNDPDPVAVHKHVETEHVKEQVPVMREDVTVERRPARPGISAESEISEDEIRVPVMAEELVVPRLDAVNGRPPLSRSRPFREGFGSHSSDAVDAIGTANG